MDSNQRRESRRSARVPRNFVVRYRGPDQRTWRVSTLKDISDEGCRLICEEPFEAGAPIYIQLSMPLFAVPVELTGRVAWRKGAFTGSMRMAEHGVQFTSLDRASRQTIAEMVQQYVQRETQASAPMPTPEGEHRHAPRVRRNFMVRYRGAAESAWKVSTLRDLSRDGCRLVCQDSYEPGGALQLQFGMPLFEHPVEISARVAWRKHAFSGTMRMSEHGVSFAQLDEAVRRRIDEAVQLALHKKT